jgi:hypothetical protein
MGDLDRPQQQTSGHHEHYCCHASCTKWGGYGFSSAAAIETRWWCWEHYPHKEPIRQKPRS